MQIKTKQKRKEEQSKDRGRRLFLEPCRRPVLLAKRGGRGWKEERTIREAKGRGGESERKRYILRMIYDNGS